MHFQEPNLVNAYIDDSGFIHFIRKINIEDNQQLIPKTSLNW